MTFMFLFIIMEATDKRAAQGFAPIAIGLTLTLIHLISIPATNPSVNPARSTGVALFVGGWVTAQLGLFWVAPIVGGILGGLVYRWLGCTKETLFFSFTVRTKNTPSVGYHLTTRACFCLDETTGRQTTCSPIKGCAKSPFRAFRNRCPFSVSKPKSNWRLNKRLKR